METLKLTEHLKHIYLNHFFINLKNKIFLCKDVNYKLFYMTAR